MLKLYCGLALHEGLRLQVPHRSLQLEQTVFGQSIYNLAIIIHASTKHFSGENVPCACIFLGHFLEIRLKVILIKTFPQGPPPPPYLGALGRGGVQNRTPPHLPKTYTPLCITFGGGGGRSVGVSPDTSSITLVLVAKGLKFGSSSWSKKSRL